MYTRDCASAAHPLDVTLLLDFGHGSRQEVALDLDSAGTQPGRVAELALRLAQPPERIRAAALACSRVVPAGQSWCFEFLSLTSSCGGPTVYLEGTGDELGATPGRQTLKIGLVVSRRNPRSLCRPYSVSLLVGSENEEQNDDRGALQIDIEGEKASSRWRSLQPKQATTEVLWQLQPLGELRAVHMRPEGAKAPRLLRRLEIRDRSGDARWTTLEQRWVEGGAAAGAAGAHLPLVRWQQTAEYRLVLRCSHLRLRRWTPAGSRLYVRLPGVVDLLYLRPADACTDGQTQLAVAFRGLKLQKVDALALFLGLEGPALQPDEHIVAVEARLEGADGEMLAQFLPAPLEALVGGPGAQPELSLRRATGGDDLVSAQAYQVDITTGEQESAALPPGTHLWVALHSGDALVAWAFAPWEPGLGSPGSTHCVIVRARRRNLPTIDPEGPTSIVLTLLGDGQHVPISWEPAAVQLRCLNDEQDQRKCDRPTVEFACSEAFTHGGQTGNRRTLRVFRLPPPPEQPRALPTATKSKSPKPWHLANEPMIRQGSTPILAFHAHCSEAPTRSPSPRPLASPRPAASEAESVAGPPLQAFHLSIDLTPGKQLRGPAPHRLMLELGGAADEESVALVALPWTPGLVPGASADFDLSLALDRAPDIATLWLEGPSPRSAAHVAVLRLRPAGESRSWEYAVDAWVSASGSKVSCALQGGVDEQDGGEALPQPTCSVCIEIDQIEAASALEGASLQLRFARSDQDSGTPESCWREHRPRLSSGMYLTFCLLHV